MTLRDLPYERALFLRMQAAVVNGLPIGAWSIATDAPLWHRFQQSLFGADIKRFAQTEVICFIQKR